jgi:outer membrane protein OmpA-like peptidoglycan-associated protein
MLRGRVVRHVLRAGSFVARSAAVCTLIAGVAVVSGAGCASKKSAQTTTADLMEQTGGPQEDGSLHGGAEAIDPSRRVGWAYSAMPSPAPSAQPNYLLKSYRCEKGSSTLNNEARGALGQLVESMNANPSMRVLCVGHADAQSEKVNAENVAMGRAQAAKQYLAGQGIAKDRIETASFGATQSKAGPDETIGQAEERRVEIWLISE